jgi:hypothetical protein
MLREEGWLAAAVGDRSGAARAYRHHRHYLALRTLAEPTGAAEAAQVRAELVRLQRKLRGLALIPRCTSSPPGIVSKSISAGSTRLIPLLLGGPRVKGAE